MIVKIVLLGVTFLFGSISVCMDGQKHGVNSNVVLLLRTGRAGKCIFIPDKFAKLVKNKKELTDAEVTAIQGNLGESEEVKSDFVRWFKTDSKDRLAQILYTGNFAERLEVAKG